MSTQCKDVRAIRMARSTWDAFDTFLVGSGFAASIFLPIWLLQLVTLLPPASQDRIFLHNHVVDIAFLCLVGWLTIIALRFGTHLEIRMRNSRDGVRSTIVVVILCASVLIIYKYISDQMIANLKAFWSNNPAAMNLSARLQDWVIGWSILLGYVAKTPWDRGKQLLQDPLSQGDGRAPLIIGKWTRIYSAFTIMTLIFQLLYLHLTDRPDSDVVRAAQVRDISVKTCHVISPQIMPLLVDGRINDEEKDIVITLLNNARAIHGIKKCSYNPKALR